MYGGRCSLALAVFVVLLADLCTAGEREALVIGNSKYAGNAVLENPGNDADAMAGALKELGFTVITKKDLTLAQMNDALVAFRRMLSKGGLGLFFYAGHGVQVRGENYLVPVGARMEEEFQVKYECVEVARVLDAMDESQSNLKVVVLDCCRDNPFQRSWRRGIAAKGLATPSYVPRGTMIAFSTSPNETAADGRGRNSPYTEQLVAVLRSRPAEGLELSEVFREASRAVFKQTQQVPWMNLDATMEKYYLWKELASSTPIQPAPQSAPQTKPQPKQQPAPQSVPEKPNQVVVVFTVRDGGENGPELSGAEVSLRWLAGDGAAPVLLGQGISDRSGTAKIQADLTVPQLAGGSYEAMITSGKSSRRWALPNFPQQLNWQVWLATKVGSVGVPLKEKPRTAVKTPGRLIRTKVDLVNERKLVQRLALAVDESSGGSWQCEPQGLRLRATAWMTSKDTFEGDFVLDMTFYVVRSDGFESKVAVSLWGISFVASGQKSNGHKTVRIQRKGNQVTCLPSDGQSQAAIIKQDFLNRPSDFTIRVYRHRQYPGTTDVLFRSLEYQGKLSGRDD